MPEQENQENQEPNPWEVTPPDDMDKDPGHEYSSPPGDNPELPELPNLPEPTKPDEIEIPELPPLTIGKPELEDIDLLPPEPPPVSAEPDPLSTAFGDQSQQPFDALPFPSELETPPVPEGGFGEGGAEETNALLERVIELLESIDEKMEDLGTYGE